jgi:hypothetical protein
MWKWTQKDENRPAPMGSPVPPVRVIPPEESLQAAVLGLQSVESSDPDVTRIGKSVVIKGDISGGGSLYLDGELEGNVEHNDRVPYGFTAIFAFDGDMLRNIRLIDKENQSTTKCSDQPITESYCLYVRRSGERFSFGGSLAGQARCASSQTPKCSVLLRHSTV